MLVALVNQKMRMKMQVTQKNSRQHNGAKEFKEISWQPTKETVEPRVTTSF